MRTVAIKGLCLLVSLGLGLLALTPFALLSVAVIGGLGLADDKPAPPKPVPAQAVPVVPKPPVAPKLPPVQTQGGFRSVQLDGLQRHPNPIWTPPPRPTLPPRPGWRYHWLPYHNCWTVLPINVAPRTIVIPDTYVLPASVTVYEGGAVAAPAGGCELTCPHCQRAFRVILQP